MSAANASDATDAIQRPQLVDPPPRRRRVGAMPGFGVSLGITVVVVSGLVLLPIATLTLRAIGIGPRGLWAIVTAPRTLSALGLSFGAAAIAAIVNAVFGTIVAWVLVRQRFVGKALLDAAVDLPFALPTAVAGIALTAIYAPTGWVGRGLAAAGVHVAFTRLGVVVAMIFVGLPFVVRTVEPVLLELPSELEEAAAVLGATRWQIATRVVAPRLLPAITTGVALAFARAVGEYGSVVFISGNMPMKTEIAPLLIVTRLEQFDYAGATALAAIMLAVSLAMLVAINLVEASARRRFGGA
jgi:sulfate transport system permease protein